MMPADNEHVPAGALMHSQPLVAVPLTATREGKTAISMVVSPPDEFASPVYIFYVNHN